MVVLIRSVLQELCTFGRLSALAQKAVTPFIAKSKHRRMLEGSGRRPPAMLLVSNEVENLAAFCLSFPVRVPLDAAALLGLFCRCWWLSPGPLVVVVAHNSQLASLPDASAHAFRLL